MKRNDRSLPFLDEKLINIIFENVYGISPEEKLDEELSDFMKLLGSMQGYNYRYRNDMLRRVYCVISKVIEFEINSEGTSIWLALCLAIKELYGMTDRTLLNIMRQVKVRK